VNEPPKFQWPNYPPLTQSDNKSDFYREIVARHELRAGAIQTMPKARCVEFTVDAEVLTRRCAWCRSEIPNGAHASKIYCRPQCSREALSARISEVAEPVDLEEESKPAEPEPERTCPVCHGPLPSNAKVDAIYCGLMCRNQAILDRRAEAAKAA
jgi:hypothetical protein